MNNANFLSPGYTTTLRAVCMIVIVFCHTANEFPHILHHYHLGALLLGGRYATGVFFFLSGYGLTLSINRNKIDLKYIGRHLSKLLVPYLFFWIFYFLIGILIGSNVVDITLLEDFLQLKMPNADAWFYRTILAIYIVYFCLSTYTKEHAPTTMCILILLYTVTLIYFNVDSWWWNTICCFPLGILFAHIKKIRCKIAPVWLATFFFLFFILHKLSAQFTLATIATPIVLCLCCAYLSQYYKTPRNLPIFSFIGANSLYIYLMEAIPIDYMQPQQVGFFVYVIGGFIITILLSYIAHFLQSKLLK